MALEQRLLLKMSQRLVMTPSLQQAIKLLQLSKLELAEEVAQELVENPVLEEQDEIDVQTEAAVDAGLDRERSLGEAPAEAPGKEVETETAGETERDAIDEIDIEALFRDPFESSGSAPNMSETRELPSLENAPASMPDLQDHLIWQLGMQCHDQKHVEVGKAIIWNLDEDGYLQATDEEILHCLESMCEEDPAVAACAPFLKADIDIVLRRLRRFDPVGVAARTLEECLGAQLLHLGLGESLAATVVDQHLDLLRQHKYAELAKKLGCEEDEAREVAAVVRELNPKPGSAFGGGKNVHVTPDVTVEKVDGEYKVLLNDDGLPKLRISPVYRRLLEEVKAARAEGKEASVDRKTRDYVKEKERSAVWFIKSLDQRQQTIYKVAESIVKHQQGFLEKGVQALRPLVLRDVAEDVELHESTISRVVTNKYMNTPQGLFEMKFFFHSGLGTSGGGDISSLAVKEKLKALIDDEPPKKPLSDSAIVKLLKAQDIDIARRTVAKYRDELNIPASPMRKRM